MISCIFLWTQIRSPRFSSFPSSSEQQYVRAETSSLKISLCLCVTFSSKFFFSSYIRNSHSFTMPMIFLLQEWRCIPSYICAQNYPIPSMRELVTYLQDCKILRMYVHYKVAESTVILARRAAFSFSYFSRMFASVWVELMILSAISKRRLQASASLYSSIFKFKYYTLQLYFYHLILMQNDKVPIRKLLNILLKVLGELDLSLFF